MTDDPLKFYRIDQPLTEEEQQLIETWHTAKGGEAYLKALERADIRGTTESDGRSRLVMAGPNRQAIAALVRRTLLPLSRDLFRQGHTGLALGASALALRLGLEVSGPAHTDALISRRNLAACLYYLGRTSEALQLYEDTLEIEERVLHPEHPNTLTSRANLAKCLRDLGRLGEALPLYERTLKIQEQVLGPAHPDTLTSRANLAECLRDLGRLGEALPLYERTLEIQEQVLGPAHPDTLTTVNNLAVCLHALGEPGEALPLFQRAFEAYERLLGPEHPDTLSIGDNLAGCFNSLGRSAEAFTTWQVTLKAREKVLGLEHPDTLASRNNLATCLQALGRSGEALPLFRGVVEVFTRVLGPEHRETLASRNNLAGCLLDLGRASEALPQYKAVLEACERIFGPEHSDTLTSCNNLARCLRALGRSFEALSLHKSALEVRDRKLGPAHPDTVTSYNNLAVSLLALGRSGEALPIFEAVIEAGERILSSDHPIMLASRNNLATCLQALGRSGEALLHYQRNLEDSERILGPEHPNTLVGLNNLAQCFEALGRLGVALVHYERALAARTRLLGAEHLDTLTSRNNLAQCLESLEQWDKALAHRRALSKGLRGLPQPGGPWFELLIHCATALANHANNSRLADWDGQFDQLSSTLLSVIDLESPEQLDAARKGVTQFFTTYLGLCIDHDRCDLIPQVLAARQGRKLAALVLDELEAAGETLDPASPRGRFQALRLELRQLALGLRVVEGGGGQSGSDGDRLLDAESAIARQRNQMAAYKAKLDEYRALRTELEASDPGFAVTAAALRPNLEDLQARLVDGEGLVLLFEQANQQGEITTRLALMLTAVTSVLVPLTEPLLNQGLALSRTWSTQLYARSGMRQGDGGQAALADTPSAADDTPASALTETLREGLWNPLAAHLTGLTHLHLVTHGNWHLLPVECGAPEGLTLSSYPGFIYYHRLRHQGELPGSSTPPTGESNRSTAPSANSAIGLAVHAAEDRPGLEPIPFVQAEAKLIEALWPGPVHPDPDLDAEHPRLATLQLAAHGQADAKDPARANVVLRDQTLDFQAVLKARQHPPVVVLSACTVGRTSDDPDGEPLGLVGSFLLKGSRYVIASVQPVPDFYTPLLITLFYQSWLQMGSPDTALAEAKRRLQTGGWYAETEGLIRRHYAPILEQRLEAASRSAKASGWRDPLLQLTHAWPFPDSYRYLDPDEHQDRLDDLREQIAESQGRPRLVAAILDALVAERGRLPAGVIDTLCTWVRGFGWLAIHTK